MTSQLPSTIGPVTFTAESVRLWCSDASVFKPVVWASTPHKEETAYKAPQTSVIPMPVSMDPSTPFIPKEYVIFLHSQLCLQCGSGHEWTQAYARNDRSTRLHFGKKIDNLVAVERFSYNVPTTIKRAPVRTVPCCQECARSSMDLSRLPRPSETTDYQLILNSFAAQAAAAAAPAAPVASPKKASPAQPTKIRSVEDMF